MATGLEPVQVFCTWSPAAHETDGRAVEGAYFIRRMPEFKVVGDNITIPPSPLKQDCIATITKCVRKVQEKLFMCTGVVEKWVQWSNEICPTTDDSNIYAEALRIKNIYIEPLQQTSFYVHSEQQASSNWKKTLTRHCLVDANFKFPEVFAMACNPIATDFTPNPSRPRTYAVSSDQIYKV